MPGIATLFSAQADPIWILLTECETPARLQSAYLFVRARASFLQCGSWQTSPKSDFLGVSGSSATQDEILWTRRDCK